MDHLAIFRFGSIFNFFLDQPVFFGLKKMFFLSEAKRNWRRLFIVNESVDEMNALKI